MHEVPNDNQVKDMLKGKTAKEKMILLQEIEKARQAKMHLDYLLQMEQINHAERWAKRNVDEREQIMTMYQVKEVNYDKKKEDEVEYNDSF